jgi:Zn-dependent protease
MDKLNISSALVTYFGFLVALTMREAVQAITARKLGDVSNETAGRATFNPIPHIDPFGTVLFPLLMLMSGINLLLGWAKPFRPDTRYFKKLKRDFNIVCLAGPGANIFFAIVAGLVLKFGNFGAGGDNLAENPAPFFLMSIGQANLIIAIFNVLPIPNTDGWKFLLNNVNYNTSKKLQDIAMPISIVFLLLLILGVLSPVFKLVLGIYHMIFAI